ncbi:hypothetical protein PMO01_21960 [Pseudomonas moraviensis R28-S]|uniref:Uncharacterized protein n=1 Tax=Pseudomonas moraviensis R28-S TaxID=1395516 RepID=V8R3M6_9PSED|nr:hypothetical protein PMO01_21960 [Pseudomonas moraviensis R28-S]
MRVFILETQRPKMTDVLKGRVLLGYCVMSF